MKSGTERNGQLVSSLVCAYIPVNYRAENTRVENFSFSPSYSLNKLKHFT